MLQNKYLYVKRILILLALALNLTCARLQALDLSNAVDMGLENDPEYLSAKQALIASREKLDQGKAPLRPSISGSLNNSQNYSSSGSNTNTATYALTISQVIYNHKLNAAQKQSFLIVKEAESNFENTKQNIFLKITSAYFDKEYPSFSFFDVSYFLLFSPMPVFLPDREGCSLSQ